MIPHLGETPFTVAAAQACVLPGDIAANVRQHLRFIEAAAQAGVQLLVFPELSLLGYELPLLARHALAPDSPLLTPLLEAASRHHMVLVVGAAVTHEDTAQGATAASLDALPGIGALAIRPDGAVAVYCKHHLHEGEQLYARAGAAPSCVVDLAGEAVGVAVCADITHPEHATATRRTGAALYACSVLLSESGYAADTAMLHGYARDHGMAVLMANHGAPTGGYQSAGRSAVWAPGGALVTAAPGPGGWLVVAQRSANGWTGAALPVPECAP